MFTKAQIDGKIAEKYPENLIFCDTKKLLSVAKDSWSITCRANCLAELLIRLYLNEEETVQTEDGKPELKLQEQVERFLSHGEVPCFLKKVKQLKMLKPDHANQLVLWRENADTLSLTCRLALEERLRILFRADGVIPVQKDGKGWMIPFDLEKGKSQYAVSDLDGNEIGEWNKSVSELKIAPYSVRVHLNLDSILRYAKEMRIDSPLTGRSLMLPVWAAYLKKEGIVPDYDPFKFILSGAFDRDGILSEVGINGKVVGLAKHYPDAIFLIPEKTSVSGLDDESARKIRIHTLPNGKQELLTQYIEQKVEQFSAEAELNRKIEAYYNDLEKESKEKQRVFNALSSASGEDSGNSLMEPQAIEQLHDKSSHTEENEDVDGLARSGKRDKEIVREKRSGGLLTLMEKIPRIAILGEPGGGKTTTLTHFVMRFHQPEKKAQQELAVLIPLGQRPTFDNFMMMISHFSGLPQDKWKKLIEPNNQLRLVLDALNECPDRLRKDLVVEIQTFLNLYRDLPVAISARTDEDLNRLNLPTFTVQPMDAEHQLIYLKSYLKDEEKAQSLQDRLLKRPGGMEIASNPLLLRMVLDVFDDHQEELPMRRANLYRRWIEQWYKREKTIAENANDPLPWDFEEALTIFSELAFQSRSQGENGEVSEEIAGRIFREYGKHDIEKLCQGPVVALIEEKNSILFRHETFQEYFCAEYLIRHPDTLPRLTKDDSAQWGMPLAYVVELLREPLPEPLLRAAWEIDPWFGFSVTDDKQLGYAAERVSKKTNPLLSQILSCCTMPPEKDTFFFPTEMMAQCHNYWYSNNDPKLEYMVLTNETIKNRWLALELGLLRKEYTPKKICFVLTRSIMLKQYAGHSIRKTFQNLLEAGKDLASSSLEEHLHAVETILLTDKYLLDATQLIQDGFASKEDCKERLPYWIRKANVFEIDHMIKMGLVTKETFEGRLPRLIETAGVAEANILIKSGLATKESFKSRLPKWIPIVKLIEAGQMVKAGLVTKEDFKDRLKNWIRDASISEADYLIKVGLATKENFKDKIDKLMNEVTTPSKFMSFVRTGLASKENMDKIIAKWKSNANPQKAIFLVQNGWASVEDFRNKISTWISDASPQYEMAVRFIHAGLASREDFEDRIEEWISEAAPETAVYLIQNRLASREDFKDRIEEWKLEADPETAVYLIQYRLASKEDFKDRIEEWKLEADPETAVYLIQNGLASRKDFKDRIAEWISEARPKTAALLIQHDLASLKELEDRIEQWIRDATPGSAVRLIELKLASKEDFKEKIEQWEEEGVETILYLIQNDLVSKDDYTAEIKTWKEEAGPEIAYQLIKCKLADRDYFKDRSKQWRLNFTYIPYKKSKLKELWARRSIIDDLRGKKWKMRIWSQNADYSLLKGVAFKDLVYCSNRLLKCGSTAAGNVLSVEVAVGHNKKDNSHFFYVRHAEYIPTGDEDEEMDPERNTASPADMEASPETDAVQTEGEETKPRKGGPPLGDNWDKVFK